jgi:hypothetical protein
MGEKLVHSPSTRKERKNRASRENTKANGNINGYRNIVESKRSKRSKRHNNIFSTPCAETKNISV